MKKLLLIIGVVAGFFIYACNQNKQTDNPEKLKDVLKEYFQGVENKDFQKMMDLTTKDFVSIDDGTIFTSDSIIKVIKCYPNLKAKYTLDNFTINVDNNSGNIRYFNNMNVVINDTIHMSPNYIQSATFKKVDGIWKLDFIHTSIRK